ncbi:hypothetical protein K491DRAFT_557092, partial [Lophiostoma macrostomum CBS 122681]
MSAMVGESRGRTVNVVAWFLLVPMTMAAIVKGYTKWKMIHKFQTDDFLILLCTLAYWITDGTIDVVTQLIVALLPIYLLKNLNLKTRDKIRPMLSFSPNILNIPLTVLRLVCIHSSLNSINVTRDSLNLALVTSFHTSISIVVASLPFSKVFIDSLVLEPHIIHDT